jgi:hypothetical protein
MQKRPQTEAKAAAACKREMEFLERKGANQVLRNCCSQRAWPAFESGIVNAGSRAGLYVAIARNTCRRFPDVSGPDHRPQALGKGCRPVAPVARLRLGLAPWPVAGVSVDRSSPGWLPQKASLWSLTHRTLPAHSRG